ncbi:MAG TPA: flagellar hook-length control protein FliK [Pseudorhizobium sp.]|nr:flagellar hook-length control protein FliK [Pseudorhizobium sp.]
MTLEVLANSTSSGTSAKGGTRTAGEKEGGSDAFSTALSKAGRDTTSGDNTAGERRERSVSEVMDAEDSRPAVSVRRSVADVMQQAGDRLPPEQVQTDKTATPASVPAIAGKTRNSRDAADLEPTAEGEGTSRDKAVDEAAGTVAPVDNAQEAAQLLSIPAGQPLPVNGAGQARTSGPSEGRKAAAASGEVGGRAASETEGAGRAGAEAPADMLEMPTAEDAAKPKDVNLRFINAKNGSLNAELTLAARSRDQGSSEAKAAMPQVENVMVLDSRRFIGMQNGSNSASLMAAMVGDQTWSAAMQPDSTLSNIASQSSSGSVVHMLKLQMTPHDLGTVTATLKMNGEQLHVHLTVETRAAHQQLSEDSSGMVDALRSQGFSVDQVTVSITPSSDADSQKGQQGSQAGQQQMTGNGERQGDLNRNQTGQRFTDVTDNRNRDDDTSPDLSAAAAADSAVAARSGQLYL